MTDGMTARDEYLSDLEAEYAYEARAGYEPPVYDYDFMDEDDPNYDPCKCSDPCCPCTGTKRGVP